MINIKIYLIVAICFLTTAFNSHAKSFSREEIVTFAKQSLEAKIEDPDAGYTEIDIPALDPRINIDPCLSPLQANIPEKNASRNVNIKIYCEDSTPWHLYVTARVRKMVPVVVTNANINKNTIIDKTNIVVVHKDQRRVRGEAISDINELVGTKAKRNLTLGTRITKRNVCFVCKGDEVNIIAKSNDFMIKAPGIALRDGAIGDKVTVRNKKSNRTVTAKVKDINNVLINL